MHPRRRPASLRTRLFLSYAALVLFSVVVASGASLWLYARTVTEGARREMASLAGALAEEASAVAGTAPITPDRLADILYDDPRVGAQPRSFLFVDGTGRPLFAIVPRPIRGPRFGRRGPEAERRGLPDRDLEPPAGFPERDPDPAGDGPPGSPRGRPPGPPPVAGRVVPGPEIEIAPPAGAREAGPYPLRDVRFAPQPAGLSGLVATGTIDLSERRHLLYVTEPLTATIDTSALTPGGSAPAPPGALHLALFRYRAEIRGLWYPLVPSVVGVGSLALALASLIAWGLARSITQPVEAMTRGSERIAAGDYAVRVPATGADEIARLAGAFNAMAAEVGEAQRRQRDFVVNVSHDLRTPLTTIRGFARALVDGTARTPEQRDKAAGAIESASARMALLVETLIDLARLEGQAGGMQQASISAADLLARVAEERRHAAEAAGVRFVVDAPARLTVRADPLWMARALGNVVDNAIRHSPPGSAVRLVAEPAAAGQVRLAVEDEGEGIPEGDLARVFERFYRGDRSRATNGSGLGLSIAREIVEGHAGTITAARRAPTGTRVAVVLPGGAPAG